MQLLSGCSVLNDFLFKIKKSKCSSAAEQQQKRCYECYEPIDMKLALFSHLSSTVRLTAHVKICPPKLLSTSCGSPLDPESDEPRLVSTNAFIVSCSSVS